MTVKIIKIGAIWCPNCIIMNPKWQEVEKSFPDIETIYYDFDENEEMLTSKYHIKDTLPVAIFLAKNDVELDRLIGPVTKKEIYQFIDKYHDQ